MLEKITKPQLLQDLGMQYPIKKSKQKKRYGLYKCYCGAEFKAQVQDIKKEKTKSCGCYNIIRRVETHTTHGKTHHPLYSVFKHMIDRTTKQNDASFKYYGGRGIVLCKEWENSFISFYDWSMDNGYKKGLSIDRIDNNGNYEPSNCRWVSLNIQARNTRKIRASNTSGYRGVSFYKNYNLWRAYITVNNKRTHLGYFNSAKEAGLAYDTYIIKNKLEHTINAIDRGLK